MEPVNILSNPRPFQYTTIGETLGILANTFTPTLVRQVSKISFVSVAGVAPLLFVGAYFASGDSVSNRVISASLSLAGGAVLEIGLLALNMATPMPYINLAVTAFLWLAATQQRGGKGALEKLAEGEAASGLKIYCAPNGQVFIKLGDRSDGEETPPKWVRESEKGIAEKGVFLRILGQCANSANQLEYVDRAMALAADAVETANKEIRRAGLRIYKSLAKKQCVAVFPEAASAANTTVCQQKYAGLWKEGETIYEALLSHSETDDEWNQCVLDLIKWMLKKGSYFQQQVCLKKCAAYFKFRRHYPFEAGRDRFIRQLEGVLQEIGYQFAI